jgi:hypothetical protein
MHPETDLDQAVVFDRLQTILHELYAKVTHHLALFHKSEQPFQHFSSPDGNLTGSLLTFSGEKVDKLIYSWLNAAQISFSTTRLTVWLNSHSHIPHLAIELGTMPNLFFYMDYIPRVDLWTDLNYTEQYYEPINSTYLELRNTPNLSVFVSKGLYVRQMQSPAHLCFTCPRTEDTLSLVQKLAHETCDRWLSWLDQAPPVPTETQAALAERDLRMRRIIAERDPGNAAVTKILGAEFANQLVRSLWDKEYNPSNG